MKQIHKASLINFFGNCKGHRDAASEISNYPFYTNLNIIKTFLEKTDFPGGVDIEDQDYKKYIAEDTFLIGIDLINDELDEYQYLFDAFNVYFCQEGSSTYYPDQNLTREWRKTMNVAYPYSTYKLDARILIEEERKKDLAEVNAKYDNEIKNI